VRSLHEGPPENEGSAADSPGQPVVSAR